MLSSLQFCTIVDGGVQYPTRVGFAAALADYAKWELDEDGVVITGFQGIQYRVNASATVLIKRLNSEWKPMPMPTALLVATAIWAKKVNTQVDWLYPFKVKHVYIHPAQLSTAVNGYCHTASVDFGITSLSLPDTYYVQ